MRGLAARLTIALAVLLSLLALKHHEGDPKGGDARPVATSTSGALSITNSRHGSPIFTAPNMAPGDTTSGTVTITNTGSVAGSLTLSQSDPVDSPGDNGGLLSRRLGIVVTDVTPGGAPSTVYSGPFAAMPARPLGNLAPKEARTFRFSASFPDGGAPSSPATGDNAYAGSSATVRYHWTATEVPPRVPQSGGAPIRHRDRMAPRLRLRIPRIQHILRRRAVVVIASCHERCTVTAYAKVFGGRSGRITTRRLRPRRLPAHRRTRLKLSLPARSLPSIRRALRRRAPASLSVVVIARDRAGNMGVVKRRINLRAVGRPGARRPRAPW